MPPKDDDDPASTKEVVTKKQKQLLNREELNLAAIAEAFDGLLLEAPGRKGSGGKKGDNRPFKDPEPPKKQNLGPDKISRSDAERLQRMTRSSDAAAERIQRDLDSQEKLERTTRKRPSTSGGRSKGSESRTTNPGAVSNVTGEMYPKDDKGRYTRKAVQNYATEVETRATASGRRTPEQVKLSKDEIAKRTRAVRDTFAAADRGDPDAQKKVSEYERKLTAKQENISRKRSSGVTEPRGGQRIRDRSTGRTRRTRTSITPPTPRIRDRSSDQPKTTQPLRDAQARGQKLSSQAQRAVSRDFGNEPDLEKVGEPKVKKGEAARTRARGQAQAQGAGRPGRGSSGRTGGQILRSLIGKEADIERIKSEIDAKEKRQAERRKAGQVKRQQTLVRKDTATRIGAQNTPEVRRTPKVGGPKGGYRAPAQPTPGNVASQPKTDPLAITKYRAKATPSGTKIPSASGGDSGAAVRRAMQQRATKSAPRSPYASVRGQLGSGLVGAAAYELLRGPTERLGNYLGNQLARGIASVSSPEVKKKLSTYNPNLVDKQGPTLTKDIVKGIQGREKQAAIDFYTSPEVKSQLDAITKTQTQTQTQTQAPSTTKTRTDVKDPKDPKTPPVKTLPIPVVPPVAKRPTTGQGNKTGGRKVPGPGLPRIGLPGYRGKIGRRSNPQ